MNSDGGKKQRPLDYPSFSSMKTLDNLIRRMKRKSKVGDINKWEDQFLHYFFSSTGLNKVSAADVYYYASASFLAESLFNVKALYYKNDLDFPETEVLSDKFLFRVQPPILETRMMTSETEGSIPEIAIRKAGEQLFQGIQTNFALIENYFDAYNFSVHKNKNVESFVKERLQDIAGYAVFAQELSTVYKEFNMRPLGGMINAVSEHLQDTDKLWHLLKTNNMYQTYNEFLETFAKKYNLPFHGDVWIFNYSSGEEVSGAMQLAKEIHIARAVVDHVKHGPNKRRKKSVIASNNHLVTINDMRSVRKNIANSESGAIFAQLMQSNTGGMFPSFTAPFLQLGEKIKEFGIPFDLAKEIELWLATNVGGREPPIHNHIQKVHEHIHKRTPNYFSAIRKINKETTGREGKKVCYKYHDSEQSLKWAYGIRPITYIAELKKDGDIQLLDELVSVESAAQTGKRMKKLFPDNDVYVRTNQGVCFLLDLDSAGMFVNPEYSIIDVRNDDYWLPNKTARDLSVNHVDFHEDIHSKQTGTRLFRKQLALSVTDFIAKLAHTLKKNNEFNTHYASDHHLHRQDRKRTKGDMLVNIAKLYTYPLLAKGEYEQGYIEEGFFNTLLRQDLLPLLNEDINFKETDNIPLHEDRITNLIKESIDIMSKGTTEDLEKLLPQLEKEKAEFVSMIEHQAEAFSLESLYRHIKNHPEKRIGEQERQQYQTSMYNKIKRRGLHAIQYQTIMSKDISLEEKEKLLNEKGLTYKKHIIEDDPRNHTKNVVEKVILDFWEEGDDIPVKKNAKEFLVELGYDQLDPEIAYENMDELIKKVKEKKGNIQDYYTEMNASKALIGLRYCTELDTYMNIIKKYGSQEAFERILNVEDKAELYKLLED